MKLLSQLHVYSNQSFSVDRISSNSEALKLHSGIFCRYFNEIHLSLSKNLYSCRAMYTCVCFHMDSGKTINYNRLLCFRYEKVNND